MVIRNLRINERIRVNEIRIIGAEGEQLGIMSPAEGVKLAQEKGLDLVEVAPQSSPPVCRIMDYSKYKYDQERKGRESHRKQKTVHLKEIRLRPKIEEHDYQVKLAHLEKFLKRGDKAKVTLVFRGREITHPERGRQIMNRFIQDLSGISIVEKGPTTEGKTIVTVLMSKGADIQK